MWTSRGKGALVRRNRVIAGFAVLVALVAVTGCAGDGAGGVKPGGGSTSAVPKALAADDANAKTLDVSAQGGGVSINTGSATAAIWVPEGAAPAGASWTVTPLTSAPEAAGTALCPGVFVDTAGKDPTAECSIAFSIPGTVSPDACIVKLADDGSVKQVMATTRIDTGYSTILTADVDGFSPYTTTEEDQEARDKAFRDREQAKGKQVDWTIKAGGTEKKEADGWTFDYEFDLFASGGGVSKNGLYKGHAMLSMEGTYDKSMGFLTSMGDLNGIGRDQNLTFSMMPPQLASLLTGEDEGAVCGSGTMNLEGMGELNLFATLPNAKGQYNSGYKEGSGGVPFTIKATTFEDVQVEIPGVGIFPGKILRTSK